MTPCLLADLYVVSGWVGKMLGNVGESYSKWNRVECAPHHVTGDYNCDLCSPPEQGAIEKRDNWSGIEYYRCL